MTSPFLELSESEWVASNELSFAIRDKYPVSEGHTLVVPRRLVPSWSEATDDEQRAILDLVNEVKRDLDAALAPDGYNVGFNEGAAAGQTVMHLHVHVIPRYRGDMDDPRGGIRHAIPSRGNYLKQTRPLATGGLDDPFSAHLLPLLSRADSVAIVAAFIQESGLGRLREDIQLALRRGACIRILTGDYLGITQADALETLVDWIAATELPDDDEEDLALGSTGTLAVRVVEVTALPKGVPSFHPKSWRFEGPGFGVAFVGSSNISYAALGSGIEWNLRVDRDRNRPAYERVCAAFDGLWEQGRDLTREWVEEYAARARERPAPLPPEEFSETRELHPPHEAQQEALTRLRTARAQGRARALVVFATGLGKTLLSILDYAQFWEETGRDHPPRLLFLAHRRELLLQAAGAFRTLLRTRNAAATVGWFAESGRELHADLVFASVAKLARTPHLEALAKERFDYVVVDEVHHAAANSYRRILGALDPGFLLGLTATPDRADGADILGLFDDFVAKRAGIDAGIRLGRLVPFHYFGIKDSIEYENIPWGSKRIRDEQVAAYAQTEARMASLWEAWHEHPGSRTLVFCCNVAHADYVRGWLQERDVEVRAVHSAPSADERSQALADLESGVIDAICAVDVFNEGIDVPAIDRVVMLRPTESNVVFLQQLGRGLRAREGKEYLTVIDYVGNHKVFLQRLSALFSLGAGRPADELRRVLAGGVPTGLPEGCSVELELEAKDLLTRLFRSDGSDEVERAYREIASSRGVRPRAGELYRMGYSPGVLRKRHGSWFEFVRGEGDLTEDEAEVLNLVGAFLRELETTPMTKSFKMVTLQALIEHEALVSGMALPDLARHAHRILRRDPALLADVPAALREKAVAETAKWRAYWKKNPVAAWTKAKKGRAWFALDGDRLVPSWSTGADHMSTAARLTTELVDYRLAQYRRRGTGGADADSFECKVLWNKRDPILKLPSRKRHTLPEGETDVRLPDGAIWSFRFAKEYCNVARPAGARRNQLPDLLRGWFGPSAGHPGTSFHVRFSAGPDGLAVAPSEGSPGLSASRRAIATFPSLHAAAGPAVGKEPPHEAAHVELPVGDIDADMFAIRIVGDSMDGGAAPLRDGDWGVFRYARGDSPSSIVGRIALLQVAEDRPAYQVKRVEKGQTGFELVSNNPSEPPISADDSMVVIARLERGLPPESLGPGRGAVMQHAELADAFGLSEVQPRTGRWSGHLFIVLDQKGQLTKPDLAVANVKHGEGETAFVLAAIDAERCRYLGVGRFESDGIWRIPEVDASTWKALGKGGVSRDLPENAQARAKQVVSVVMALPEGDRILSGPKGNQARVLGTTARGGLRIEGLDGAFKERPVSVTDIAWVVVAADDVAENGGMLDEARVNRLRYLEGTPKGSTRWIDTGWAIGAWRLAEPILSRAPRSGLESPNSAS